MRRILIAAVASSLLTGAAIAATGVAQSGDDGKDKPPPTMAQALKSREAERDKHMAAVAKRLDVSAGDLEGAIGKARDAELDKAVADGRLTGAQRDALRACKDDPLKCDRSNLPAPRMERLRRGDRPDFRAKRREMTARRNAFFAAVAKELGKEAADVRKAFEAERPARGLRRRGPGRGPHGPGPHGRGGPPGDMVMPAPGPGPGGPEGFGPSGP